MLAWTNENFKVHVAVNLESWIGCFLNIPMSLRGFCSSNNQEKKGRYISIHESNLGRENKKESENRTW